MPNLLISGPAGGGKSAIAREILQAATAPTVVADFQSIVVALLQLQRGPDGRYPPRPDFILPTAEYVRRVVISQARDRGIDVVATNSDGSPSRRGRLLEALGRPTEERVVDPGRATVEARLSGPDGVLSDPCRGAVERWYSVDYEEFSWRRFWHG